MSLFKKLFSTLLFAGAALSAQAETFVFTAIPDEDESRLQQRFNKVADYLSEQLDVDVKYIPVKSYAAAITAFRNNQVQLAWFGGLSGVQARRLVPGSEAIAQGYEDQFFKSYFIANSSTGLTAAENLTDALKGKTFTFGSKGSTSGRLMPEFYLREAFKAAPEDVFERVGFSGDHSRTIAQVQSGAYQVGAVNYTVWENELAAGNIDPAKVSVIWETPTYTDYQWTIRGDVNSRFGEGFKDKVRQALLNMKDKDLLASFPRESFVPATNADYQAIEDTAKAIGLID
ncbi:MAG: putative selenate ABC transporter substrate-binding protein [Oceanospirillaceae bacterium]|uniref:putative selenate ABC transporter substrate-binding protein n=1 Tax=unclassified Thalassolituus TaxID=2624967 RepID=UPI000C0A4347|nr:MULTISPECIES: putative selenate ABC transporter substrate-binding protein [unclassified Thalassolituus]MAK91589.1 putative selenate ABC transporter substrate-binding protein [Thalassolituus sp.]MAS25829.1 putative selenate ABC transporter substrate-binding protein [Oceanospirillaceae bacterium]MAY00121.1 putative selenate ABC transporter substrate-binding protein [Oceanospirillaceae bacterium]MBL35726.1 putative selenate ABC transporter substrate-binding protein [Oceanospirillaceae bacterium|tara:strand:- start:8820 stop:9680 length:861 start_codon:yes stop_codon:yes gene_type:complete